MARPPDWTAPEDSKLEALWIEGHTSAEIGRMMGKTKNAILGRVHRLKLAARASPITQRSDDSGRPLRVRNRSVLSAGDALVQGARELAVARRVSAPRPVVVAPVPVARPVKYGRVVECCWPIGEPGTKGFRFCLAVSERGRPYCSAHCEVAFIPARLPVAREAMG